MLSRESTPIKELSHDLHLSDLTARESGQAPRSVESKVQNALSRTLTSHRLYLLPPRAWDGLKGKSRAPRNPFNTTHAPHRSSGILSRAWRLHRVADFIVRRLVYSMVALVGVITIVFFLLHMS